MTLKFNALINCIAIPLVCLNSVSAQESTLKADRINKHRYAFYNSRGTNSIDLAIGSSILDIDYPDFDYESYFRVGYKKHITSHLSLGLTFNKYNVAINDTYNEGFMSFDLNAEFLLSPFTKFSPFLYVGGGYNAANYFETATNKAQAGFGLEYIITTKLGLKLFGEYNYTFTDELDGLISGDTDDSFIRVGLGLHVYFGGKKKKEMYQRKLKTVINSNLIVPYN